MSTSVLLSHSCLDQAGGHHRKSKLSRALGFMTPVPRLTVLPPGEHSDLWTR